MRLVPNVNFDTPTIEDSELVARSWDILGRARKKFAFVIGLKMTPGSDLAQNLFEIWNWFWFARFCVSLLVGFVFCFLCGNKIKPLHRLVLTYIFATYPIQKTFFLWLNLLTFGCTFFFLAMSSRLNCWGV